MSPATRLPVDIGPIHFCGIGGIGMSGIAEVLLNLGYPVQGSDLKASKITARLEELGAKVFIGQIRVNDKRIVKFLQIDVWSKSGFLVRRLPRSLLQFLYAMHLTHSSYPFWPMQFRISLGLLMQLSLPS